MRLDVRTPVTDFVFGFGLFNADGVCCYETNTDLDELVSQEINGEGQEFVVDSLDLTEGTYKIDVAVHRRDGYSYDYHRPLTRFASSRGRRTSASIVRRIAGRSPAA